MGEETLESGGTWRSGERGKRAAVRGIKKVLVGERDVYVSHFRGGTALNSEHNH